MDSPLEFYEENMFDAHIVPCRGRVSREARNYTMGSFTGDQLDRVAPLSAFVRAHLSFDQNPPPSVQKAMQKRIDAARQLKYGE